MIVSLIKSSIFTISLMPIIGLLEITSSTVAESLILVLGIILMKSSTDAESVITRVPKYPNASSTNTESLILKITILRVILSSTKAKVFGGGCAIFIINSSIEAESDINLVDICPVMSSTNAESLGLYVTVIDMTSSIMAESSIFVLSEPVTRILSPLTSTSSLILIVT